MLHNSPKPSAKKKPDNLATTETINGKELEMLSMGRESTIQTVNAFRDIGSGLKTLAGGELTKYNEMMNNARALAAKRMAEEAENPGADAVVAIRYATAERILVDYIFFHSIVISS